MGDHDLVPTGDDPPALLRALLQGSTVPIEGEAGRRMSVIRAARPIVVWFGVNERRVDAVVDAGVDQYRIVYVTSDGVTLDELSVHRRPPPLEVVEHGQVVVVNGPSGAGKSSVLVALSQLSNSPWVLFDEPVLGAVDEAYLIWRDRAPQLHRGFLDAIAALARRGNRVALSAAGHSATVIDEAFDGLPTCRVGLDCDVDTLLARERGREGRWGGLVAATLTVHDGWRYDARFDSASLTADAIAAEVLLHTR